MVRNLKAIILAAGQGNRIKPLTNEKPKCMVELFGKSLLKWQLDLYQKLQINDISIVTGYLKEKIFFPNIKFFENKSTSLPKFVLIILRFQERHYFHSKLMFQ